MSTTAKRDDPALWEKVKKRVTDGDKGGHAGEWSARKAQLAVSEYKKAGGGYVGRKRADNSLHEWTEEEWGTKSGKESLETGERYLPKKAREALSDGDYARTTAKKRRDLKKGRQHSAQPKDVAEKAARARHGEPTKADLLAEARKRDIPGRSKMDKAALMKALGR
ncbi:hypothetical protein [Sphingomonas jatrophae]|uniref:Uncharacterized protein n=1 Tax=Sphingomonas jatrophae TaxID=1166337 RepID=A0A1I6LKV6_9SPHN|nr:hypothetical protein [Sphingomonas jatrophae]SFS04028.1 hypothetical protein SAMN05192580_2866 [Sphingomonas jatrophae]